MKTSIATVCLSGGLHEKLDAIAKAGFRGVEIFESDLLSYSGTPADVAKQIADLGLKVSTFQPFRDFEGTPEPQRTRRRNHPQRYRAEPRWHQPEERALDRGYRAARIFLATYRS